MHLNLLTCSAALTALALAAPAAARDRGTMRFRGTDRNNDGVITRDEWRGSDRSFEVHDCNGDGKLSGDEVRPGAHPCDRRVEDEGLGALEFRDWAERGFRNLDHNNDGRITRDEWHFDREAFRRVDYNHDGVITRQEFLGGEDDDRNDRFTDLDVNRDGRVSRDEWRGTPAFFDQLDVNHDRVLTRAELGRVDRPQSRSLAYRSGYERGRADGRAAGKEDRERNQGYEPVGQRELDTADAGYEERLGPRPDYQAGYRAGFAAGYPEGWNSVGR